MKLIHRYLVLAMFGAVLVSCGSNPAASTTPTSAPEPTTAVAEATTAPSAAEPTAEATDVQPTAPAAATEASSSAGDEADRDSRHRAKRG